MRMYLDRLPCWRQKKDCIVGEDTTSQKSTTRLSNYVDIDYLYFVSELLTAARVH